MKKLYQIYFLLKTVSKTNISLNMVDLAGI